MKSEYVTCSCCGQKVKRNDIELSFQMPDDLFSLRESGLEGKCQFNDDIFIYDKKDFYVRCILPLPVFDLDKDYCIGVWVKISEPNFKRIEELWDEVNLDNEPMLKGVLANEIPYNVGTKNTKILLKLMADSRPRVFIQDTALKIYEEQNKGIFPHRAAEYSNLIKST